MLPALRGHHLICLHFFHCEEADSRFAAHLKKVIRLADREEVEIVRGADAVCRNCSSLIEGKCCSAAQGEDEIGMMDEQALRLLGFEGGSTAEWREIALKIPVIFGEWHEKFCGACPWKTGCEKDPGFRQLASKS